MLILILLLFLFSFAISQTTLLNINNLDTAIPSSET